MIHEQLWILLSNYKDVDFIDAEIVFIVVRLLMDNIKETADTLAVDIHECLLQYQQKNPSDEMLAGIILLILTFVNVLKMMT